MTDNAMMYSEGPKLSTYEKDALTAIDKIYEDYPEETQFAVLTGIWVTLLELVPFSVESGYVTSTRRKNAHKSIPAILYTQREASSAGMPLFFSLIILNPCHIQVCNVFV